MLSVHQQVDFSTSTILHEASAKLVNAQCKPRVSATFSARTSLGKSEKNLRENFLEVLWEVLKNIKE